MITRPRVSVIKLLYCKAILIMISILENNQYLFFGTYVAAIILWILSAYISNLKLKKSIRYSIIYLSLPFVYIGHPFLYYQVWMLLVGSVVALNVLWSLAFISIWVIVIYTAIRKASENVAI